VEKPSKPILLWLTFRSCCRRCCCRWWLSLITCSCGFCHDGRRCCCCFNHAPPRSFMQPTKSTIAHTSNSPKRHRGLPPESTATHIKKIEEVKEMILHDDELTSATVIVNYCCCRRLLCVMGNDVYMGVWLLVPMWWIETARRPLLMADDGRCWDGIENPFGNALMFVFFQKQMKWPFGYFNEYFKTHGSCHLYAAASRVFRSSILLFFFYEFQRMKYRIVLFMWIV